MSCDAPISWTYKRMALIRTVGILVCAFAVTVDAQLECKLTQNIHVICSPGDGDNVVPKGLLSGNSTFITITLRSCHIIDIHPDAFENDTYVKKVDLSDNKLTNLEPTFLYWMPQLTHLNLSYNKFRSIKSGFFNLAHNLEEIDLKGNQLEHLLEDIFIPLRELSYINLSNNKLTGKDLYPYIFEKSRKIKHMDLSRNDMSNASDILLETLTKLEYLNLEECSLEEIPQFITKPNLWTLKHLILSDNHIAQISSIYRELALKNWENLEILDLATNNIEFIDSSITSLRNLKTIILRYNRLNIISVGFFKNMEKLEEVDLSNNLVEYVSYNAFYGTSLKRLILDHNRLSYFDTNFFMNLRNFGLSIQEVQIHNNPWQCACLNEILKELKNFNIGYKREQYNGMHQVCVMTETFTCKRKLVDREYFSKKFYSLDNSDK